MSDALLIETIFIISDVSSPGIFEVSGVSSPGVCIPNKSLSGYPSNRGGYGGPLWSKYNSPLELIFPLIEIIFSSVTNNCMVCKI